jgi:hypothetical protein
MEPLFAERGPQVVISLHLRWLLLSVPLFQRVALNRRVLWRLGSSTGGSALAQRPNSSELTEPFSASGWGCICMSGSLSLAFHKHRGVHGVPTAIGCPVDLWGEWSVASRSKPSLIWINDGRSLGLVKQKVAIKEKNENTNKWKI